jgi:hypothetical protein
MDFLTICYNQVVLLESRERLLRPCAANRDMSVSVINIPITITHVESVQTIPTLLDLQNRHLRDRLLFELKPGKVKEKKGGGVQKISKKI